MAGRLKKGDVMPHRKSTTLYIHGKVAGREKKSFFLTLDEAAMRDLAELQARRHKKSGLIFGATALVKEALHTLNMQEKVPSK